MTNRLLYLSLRLVFLTAVDDLKAPLHYESVAPLHFLYDVYWYLIIESLYN